MKINIGSKNKNKIEALSEILKDYPDFCVAQIIPKEVSSNISDQPKSLDETIQGAINRAKNAFENCDYSVGLESGLMKVPETKSGYMDFTACAIFDGGKIHLGLSSAFEHPRIIIDKIFNEGLDASTAFHKAGLTNDTYIGYSEGIIGLLTKNKLTRKEYTKEAIRTALIHLENKDLY
ncbi:MAG: inosine/xanthosine triphosphatase [Candidatus Staskawiczbacteria bacterium]|nr:inosine/xanthosine triphosphatase [Candidatus Staskawiczbacteria bacterium]